MDGGPAAGAHGVNEELLALLKGPGLEKQLPKGRSPGLHAFLELDGEIKGVDGPKDILGGTSRDHPQAEGHPRSQCAPCSRGRSEH